MRIRSIRIIQWRHFQNIELRLDEDAALVCIVGANGTGKSHLLEFIAACAHRLGLSQGLEIPRGDPFQDQHDFSLQLYLAPGVSDAIDTGLAQVAGYAEWDRTLTIRSRRIPDVAQQEVIEAGGVADPDQKVRLAAQIVTRLQSQRRFIFSHLMRTALIRKRM